MVTGCITGQPVFWGYLVHSKRQQSWYTLIFLVNHLLPKMMIDFADEEFVRLV